MVKLSPGPDNMLLEILDDAQRGGRETTVGVGVGVEVEVGTAGGDVGDVQSLVVTHPQFVPPQHVVHDEPKQDAQFEIVL